MLIEDMIIKKLEALLNRLPMGHPKRPDIEKELNIRRAGYHGERSIDYHLKLLSKKDYSVLQSLRIPFKGDLYFQIDTLILTPSFALIVEVKNLAGTLYFDGNFGQLIQTTKDAEKGYQDPLAQARRQQYQLREWFASNHCPPLPIEYLVVITNPQTILKTNVQNKYIYKRVLHSHHLLERVLELKNQYKKEVVDSKTLKKLAKLLLRENTPLLPNVLEKYEIAPTEIKTGVQCPVCAYIPMKRIYGTWLCPKCQTKDKLAYLNALKDYFFLIDTSITNNQFRKFLQLSSENVATHILTALKLPYKGSTKGRVYSLEPTLSEFTEINKIIRN